MRGPRSIILLFPIAGILMAVALAQPGSLGLERQGDRLNVAAPHIRLLSGKALERLRDGSSVTYSITVTAKAKLAPATAFRLQERFVVSFDLWEEKFAVIQLGGRAASRLSADGVVAWMLEAMPVPVQAVPDRQPFTVRLECFVDESEADKDHKNASGLTLAGLIDVFSRKPAEAPLRWEATSADLRLNEIKDNKKVR